MPNDNDLIERYLYAITRHLPSAQRSDVAEELRTLRSLGRAHFDYFRSIGFVPTGFLPNCYGKNYHGIIMVKSLL